MALLKGNPEYLLAFNGSRLIIRINLDYIVIAVLLGFEDFQGFRLISGGNDAVRHLPLDNPGRGTVTHI